MARYTSSDMTKPRVNAGQAHAQARRHPPVSRPCACLRVGR